MRRGAAQLVVGRARDAECGLMIPASATKPVTSGPRIRVRRIIAWSAILLAVLLVLQGIAWWRHTSERREAFQRLVAARERGMSVSVRFQADPQLPEGGAWWEGLVLRLTGSASFKWKVGWAFSVQSWHLTGSVTDGDLEATSVFRELQTLEVNNYGPGLIRMSDDGVSKLAGLVSLKQLTLKCPQVTDRGLSRLAELRQLRVLDLGNCNIDGTGFASWPTHAALVSLNVQRTRFDDEGLGIASERFPNLDSLDATYTPVFRMKGWRSVSRPVFPSLTSFECPYPLIETRLAFEDFSSRQPSLRKVNGDPFAPRDPEPVPRQELAEGVTEPEPDPDATRWPDISHWYLSADDERFQLLSAGERIPLAAGDRAGETWNGNGLGMEFCWCPPGTFTMGSPEDEPERMENERQVQVTLSGFWIGKFEVTQAEWLRIMRTTLRDQQRAPNRPRFGESPLHPMYWVDHYEAEEFARELTRRERAAGRLPKGWEYRLPTEAQWEYACRAGTKTATAFGNSLSSRQANFDGDFPYNDAEVAESPWKTTPVGRYPANAWGLHDMHGNVYEWCRDLYTESLPGGADPEVVHGDPRRVVRGGEWGWMGSDCRSAARGRTDADSRTNTTGFRVALVAIEGGERGQVQY